MLGFEHMKFRGGVLVAYSATWHFSEAEAELTDPPEEREGVSYNGVWYPVDDEIEDPLNYQERDGMVSYNGFWYPIDDGEEIWCVDLPFADVSDAELRDLYHDPLDYVDPWPEVYDMEYLE